MGKAVPKNLLPKTASKAVPANLIPKKSGAVPANLLPKTKAVPANLLPSGLKNAPQKQGVFSRVMNQLVKPVASASNALEDVAKVGGYGIAKLAGYKGNFQEASKKGDINFLQHQKDVWSGKNQRTYSDITREIGNDQSNPVLKNMIKTVGYGGDFMLDPLNKVKVLSLTGKGTEALKAGKLGLSAAEQASKGERAVLRVGKYNVLPKVVNKAILGGATKVNDLARGTKIGAKVFNAGAAISSKIRPAGVARDEFKALTDAKTAARNTLGYTQDKAVEFAKNLGKTLNDKKATVADRAQLLHAIEKGDKALAPSHLQDVFDQGVEFKTTNENLWKKLGGATLEGHGLSHVATKEVAEAARKDSFKGGGFKLTSTQTPQDIHRQYMKVDGKVVNIGDEGIIYDKTKGFLKPTTRPVLSETNAEIIHAENSKKKLIDNLAQERRALEESVSGGQTREIGVMDEGFENYGGSMNMRRFSEHSPEYRNYFKQYGKKPPLEFWRKKVLEDVSKGNHPSSGEVKAIDDYISSVKSQPLQEGNPLIQEARKQWVPANVSQASAKEINEAMAKSGKNPLFQEDLPIVAAKMGISTGRKQAGVEFLEATKGLKGEQAKALANETYEKMTNNETVAKAIEYFDKAQNIWKAQALVAPSYHIRNFAGNLWNNFLADVKSPAYAMAGNLQRKSTFTKAEQKLITEMEQHGVIGTGQFTGDIAEAIDSQIGKTSKFNPLSQKFFGYRANRALGSWVEDNAKMAHYISKRAEGYGAKQAAESVKKYLFDYGDLTGTEKGLLKRVMPFYTWTSKNVPLQIQQFVENPGKFSKIAAAKKDIEQGVPQPNEKYMSDYIKGNAPIRIKKDKDGNTMYFLSGAWLPATSAISFLSNPKQSALGMITPMAKLPYENITGKGTFFQNTLGEYEDIQKFPGQKTSYLGLDMNPRTVNNLRSIRPLNELNNLNPGEIFGSKNSPSIFKGLLPNASNVRGGQNTPETSQQDRVMNSFIGKYQGYNPDQSKTYYDRDTQSKVTEFNTAINRALNNDQTDLASGLIKEMDQFVQQRDGQPNKALQMYNLLGDKYFQDQAKNKQAEKERGYIRDDMKKQIREGISSGDYTKVTEALKKDPSYAQQALKDALSEKQNSRQTPEQKKMLYELEQMKTKMKLNPFYK